jgi:AbrB family looped-hinge helix DNA binding protein
MKAVVSQKGRVTIPKLLRDRLGLGTGQVLEFREDRGRLVAVKLPPRDPISAVYGILDLRGSTETAIGKLRGGGWT